MRERIIYLAFFFFPLSVIGLEYNGYIFNISTIIIIIYSLYYILFVRQFHPKILLILVMLYFWFFITSLINEVARLSLLSLTSLIFMSLPVSYKFSDRETGQIMRGFRDSIIAVSPFLVYDILVSLLGIPPLENIFTPFASTSSGYVMGIYRIKGSFLEPSYLAIYLNLYLYITFHNKTDSTDIFRPILIIALIVLTFSLTGYILLILIVLFYSFSKKKRFVRYYIIAIVLFGILLPNLTAFMMNRVFRAIKYYQYGMVELSEGSRVNTINVMFDYFKKEGGGKALYGEGFSNHDKWLMNEYASYSPRLVAYARGHINNIISVIGISSGIIGIIIYMMLLRGYVKNISIKKSSLLLLISINITIGFLIGNILWQMTVILIINDKYYNEKM